MENDKHYFRVGLFILATLAACLVFVLWLTAATSGKTTQYRIHFSEDVSGLSVGSEVKFRGVNVGDVRTVAIDPDDVRLIVVTVRILKDTPVRQDTVASLKLKDISGSLYVDLTGGDKDSPELALENGMPEIRSQRSSLNTLINRLPQLLEKSTALLDKLNHIASQIDRVLSNQNVETVNKLIAKMANYFGIDKKNEHQH